MNKFISLSKLTRFYSNLTGKILNTTEEISANTNKDMVAGALALKSVNNSLNGLSFAQDSNGNWGYKVGADPVVPFSSGILWTESYTSNVSTINCGFKPDVIITAFDGNASYPVLHVIDYVNETAVQLFHNISNNNGNLGYNFTNISSTYTRTDTGFTRSSAMRGNSTYPVRVWCMKF